MALTKISTAMWNSVPHHLSHDFNVDDVLFVDVSDNKVGIGTTSPIDQLHIKSTTTDARMVLDGHTGFDAELKFFEAGTAKYTVGYDAATANFVIGTTNVDTNQRLVINSSGNSTFYGDVTLSKAGTPILKVQDTTNNHYLFMAADDNNSFFRSDGTMLFQANFAATTNSMMLNGTGLGIGISSGMTYPLTIKAASGNNSYVHFVNSTTGTAFSDGFQIGVPDGSSDALLLQKESAPMKFYTAGTERMRIDSSGNVGIGTTSPSQTLNVNGNARIDGGLLVHGDYFVRKLDTPYFTHGTANLACNVEFGNNSMWGYIEIHITSTYSNQNSAGALIARYSIGTNPNNLIYTNSKEIIAADGTIPDNIALGDFAWDSGTSQYVIPISHIVSSGNSYAVLVKMFTDGNGAVGALPDVSISSLYTLSALSKQYKYVNDRLGIGTISPSEKFEVSETSNVYAKVTSTNGANAGVRLNSSGVREYGIFSDGALRFYDFTVATERMRIDSSGLVGIGHTNPISYLAVRNNARITWGSGAQRLLMGNQDSAGVNNPAIIQAANGTLYFGGGNNWSAADGGTMDYTMTLQDGGTVGIGITAPQARLHVDGPLNYNTGAWFGDGFILNSLYHYVDAPVGISGRWNGTDNGAGISFNSRNTGNSNWLHGYISQGRDGHLKFGVNGAGTTPAVERMRLEQGGDLHVDGDVIAFSTTVSDERLKENISTIDNALEKVNQLRGVKYTWKTGSKKGKTEIGIIAQEVENVIPEIVTEKVLSLVDGKTYKTVDYEKIIGVLIQAVKELSEEIKQLKSK